MDNLCHTLVGVALAQAGLKARTALGTVTLVIGANLPDIDVVSVPWNDVSMFEFRRGWTHGILALLVLPFLLTGIMIAWDRLVRRRGGRSPRETVEPGQLLLLSAVSVVSHPILDYMNTYGMRWLMPFRNQWFYGDTLFIIDPWLWLLLGGGAIVAWRRGREQRARGREEEIENREQRGESRGRKGGERSQAQRTSRPAQLALAIAAAYTAVMLTSTLIAQHVVAGAIASAGFAPVVKMMVGPVPANPFRRVVVFDTREHYRVGTFNWLPVPLVVLDGATVRKQSSDPAAAAAAATDVGRAFLRWARFPFFVIEREPSGTVVRIGDARYTVDPQDSWAAVTVRLPPDP